MKGQKGRMKMEERRKHTDLSHLICFAPFVFDSALLFPPLFSRSFLLPAIAGAGGLHFFITKTKKQAFFLGQILDNRFHMFSKRHF